MPFCDAYADTKTLKTTEDGAWHGIVWCLGYSSPPQKYIYSRARKENVRGRALAETRATRIPGIAYCGSWAKAFPRGNQSQQLCQSGVPPRKAEYSIPELWRRRFRPVIRVVQGCTCRVLVKPGIPSCEGGLTFREGEGPRSWCLLGVRSSLHCFTLIIR